MVSKTGGRVAKDVAERGVDRVAKERLTDRSNNRYPIEVRQAHTEARW